MTLDVINFCLILPTITILLHADPPVSPNPILVKNATHRTLMWSPPFLWPGQRIQLYNISVTNNEIVEYRMLDTSLTNPIITVAFPKNPSLLVNTQNIPTCIPTITLSISPIYDGSVLEPVQNLSISDWTWTFTSGKHNVISSAVAKI